ncbi:hypothetical protein AYI69_g9856 [Smittium culicis]|uniref:Uncharacterized protein n=1 Tax=Smittium culicis TaxID=133412 RepID=A0A1R1X9S0_9FUNG|nr:hypothetical protein AYI69_g9856 [Smittium culicis]
MFSLSPKIGKKFNNAFPFEVAFSGKTTTGPLLLLLASEVISDSDLTADAFRRALGGLKDANNALYPFIGIIFIVALSICTNIGLYLLY